MPITVIFKLFSSDGLIGIVCSAVVNAINWYLYLLYTMVNQVSLASSFQEGGPNETLVKDKGNAGHKIGMRNNRGRQVQGQTVHIINPLDMKSKCI